MKQTFTILAMALLCSACGNSQNKIQGAGTSKEYVLAYNIHIPDTTKDDWEILAMNLDGSSKKNITNNRDVAWTYYAYKKRLFFVSDRDTCYRCFFLYEMNASGTDIKRVSNLQLEDSYMSSRKDGEEIVVSGRVGRTSRYQLYIINSKTGSYTQITSDTAAMYGDPCFSPDGKQIVFSYKKNRRDRSTHEELYIMRDDGSGIMQISRYPENNRSAKENGYKAGAPRWHPTENFISYISMQDGRHNIFAVTQDGKKQWKLTDSQTGEGWHDWSSDGKWLAYDVSYVEGKQYHIMLMNWKTREKKQLTDSSYKSQLAPVFLEK